MTLSMVFSQASFGGAANVPSACVFQHCDAAQGSNGSAFLTVSTRIMLYLGVARMAVLNPAGANPAALSTSVRGACSAAKHCPISRVLSWDSPSVMTTAKPVAGDSDPRAD